MIMGYVCNLVPEDDRSARLESLLISLFCLSEWSGGHLTPLSLHRDWWVRPPGGPAWDDLELDGPWILHGNAKKLSRPAFSPHGWTLQCFASLCELLGKIWNHYLQNKRFKKKICIWASLDKWKDLTIPGLHAQGGWKTGGTCWLFVLATIWPTLPAYLPGHTGRCVCTFGIRTPKLTSNRERSPLDQPRSEPGSSQFHVLCSLGGGGVRNAFSSISPLGPGLAHLSKFCRCLSWDSGIGLTGERVRRMYNHGTRLERCRLMNAMGGLRA